MLQVEKYLLSTVQTDGYQLTFGGRRDFSSTHWTTFALDGHSLDAEEAKDVTTLQL